ncbi:MAG: hypothetical protein U1E23_03620 [Reyranellaceae bacterium]
MTQVLHTYGVPFEGGRVADVEQLLERQGRELRPGGRLRDVLRRQGLHFASLTVVPGDPGRPAHLMVETSLDESAGSGARAIGTLLATEMAALLDAAGVAPGDDIVACLTRHEIRLGSGLLGVAGLGFCGTPGMSLNRILDEHQLARRIRDCLDGNRLPGGPALAQLDWLRARVFDSTLPTDLQPLREAEPVAALPAASGLGTNPADILGIVPAAAWAMLWPIILPLAALVVGAGLLSALHGGLALGFAVVGTATLLALVILVGVVTGLYVWLRRLEGANQPDDTLPDPAVLERVVAHENRTMQNHLAGISIMQAGWLRRITLRLAFLVIGLLAQRRFRPGYLGDIGTIHFARWVLLPGTDRLLFFSNYGGSWESYLEDFITKASDGLTGVWSNTIGFPRTENLFKKGATDGERFKRWARRQQRPTLFWYSAYPHLTTARIRANAAIRQGLVTASTDDEAAAWFSLLGSSARPIGAIETEEVQSVFFGGMKRQPAAASVICALPQNPPDARAWLREIEPRVTFGEALPVGTAHILGLSAEAMGRLGLPEDTLAQFPTAFRQGMAHPLRARILSDTGDDKPEEWLWGAAPAAEAVVNIYAENAAALDGAIAGLQAELQRHGGRCLHVVRLEPPAAPDGGLMHEPFGFADGVSQPIVRGTKRWVRNADAIHTVEPGEFLFGYPDNRGYTPPSPRLRASADPANVLSVIEPRHSDGFLLPNFSVSGANSDRDFGRNGSFLVVRQLEQDVAAFEGFLDDAAGDLAGRAGVPASFTHAQRAEWIGAKMVGRWKDGTSLVRNPSEPGTGWNGKRPATPDNDFLFGAEDPTGLRCPFGAHVRRTNPRESFSPGSMQQLAITNRHRILRRGRKFAASGSGDPSADKPGLYFMCLNLDIERQFEFVQQTWAMALQFHGLENEVDAILSRGGRSARLTLPTTAGPVTVRRFKDFVRVRGGAYFFLPGRRSLRYLAGGSGTARPVT